MKKVYGDVIPMSRDKKCVFNTNLWETCRNGNMMVMGAPGTGKTCGVTIPILYNMKNSNGIAVFTKSNITTIRCPPLR